MRSVLLAVHEDVQASFLRVLETARPESRLILATSPEQARDCFRTWQSELVIADVRLSLGGMLDFVGWLQQQHPDTQIIALCELDSFERVQRILRPDSADYLIQPFAPAALAQLLDSIQERSQALAESGLSIRPVIDRASGADEPGRVAALLEKLAAGTADEACRQSLSSLFPAPQGCALLLSCLDKASLYASYDILQTYLGGSSGVLCGVDEAHLQILALVWLAPHRHTEWLRQQLTAASAHLRYASGASICVGVSLPHEDLIAQGQRAFEQAAAALAYRFYAEEGCIVLYEDNALALRQDLPALEPWAKTLEKALSEGNGSAAQAALSRMFVLMDSWPRIPPQRVLRYVHHLLQRLIRQYAGEEAEALSGQALGFVEESRRLPELAKAASRVVAALLLPASEGRKLSLCLEALAHDPCQPLTLYEAAQRYGIPADELDEGILAKTGLPFTLYQRKKRIELSQKMLEAGQLPLSVIAAQVGYPDIAHFGRAYQRVLGEALPG